MKENEQEFSTNVVADLRKRLANSGRDLHKAGLIIGTSGNISARIPGTETFLIKPSGSCMEFLKPGELVIADFQGNKIKGEANVSMETPIHGIIYTTRKDVQAVVHTHAPIATVFGIARKDVLPLQIELFMLLPNGVPVVPYEPPGSERLANAIKNRISSYDALLLENHGILTVGSTIEAACNLNKMVEEGAKIHFLTIMLAGRDTIDLAKLRKKFKK